MADRRYRQKCPIAVGLDILGERWTLLILREMLGGPRRYSDLRRELPGIATNLLADRLRTMEADGLLERAELPPPVARTVYQLTDRSWRQIPAILQALATFGLDRLTIADTDQPIRPLTGFLAGILLAFDPTRATFSASYQVTVDDRAFRFDVREGRLGAASSEPHVSLTASAVDLVLLRRAPDAAAREEAKSRLRLDGNEGAQARFRALFDLTAGPAVRPAAHA